MAQQHKPDMLLWCNSTTQVSQMQMLRPWPPARGQESAPDYINATYQDPGSAIEELYKRYIDSHNNIETTYPVII